MFKKFKGAVQRVAVGVAVAAASASVFAQTSGSGGTTQIDGSATMQAVNAVGPVLVQVGGSVLSVVAIAWGYRMVRNFVGR